MGCRGIICALLLIIALASWAAGSPACPAAGCSAPPPRARRDVLETMQQAWSDAVGAVKETGEKIKYAFQPTTSRIDGLIDNLKQAG